MEWTNVGLAMKNMSRGVTPKNSKVAEAIVDGYEPREAMARALEAFAKEFGGDTRIGSDVRLSVTFTSFATIAEVVVEPEERSMARSSDGLRTVDEVAQELRR